MKCRKCFTSGVVNKANAIFLQPWDSSDKNLTFLIIKRPATDRVKTNNIFNNKEASGGSSEKNVIFLIIKRPAA